MGIIGEIIENKKHSAAVAVMCLGRTPEEQKIIKYFKATGGCMGLKSPITDDQYYAIVQNKIKEIDITKMALQKIGLDASQVSEIPPIIMQGFGSPDKEYGSKFSTKYGRLTATYEITQLFFSATQIYCYQVELSLMNSRKTEQTEEYFYRDITNLSTKTSPAGNSFTIVVPGDKFTCSVSDPAAIKAIQAMKAKYREKKV